MGMEILPSDLENMQGRSFLKLADVSDVEMMALLDLADALKIEGRKGRMRLAGRSVAMLFEKASTRTRCATAVAMASEGGHVEYLSGKEIHLGKKESVADTGRVLGRMFDGIMFRGFKQSTVEALARSAGKPVWNGLTDECHPTQALAGLMTVREHFSELQGLRFVYVGDGRNNVASSFMLGCAKAGMDCCVCAPAELAPRGDAVNQAAEVAESNDARISFMEDPEEAVRGANVIYTDVWASMGEESRLKKRIEVLSPYQVNMRMIRQTGNLEAGRVVFLHCLPAYHDNNTDVTKELGALEVTDEVFESAFSKVFDEAENRLHTIKALMLASICRD